MEFSTIILSVIVCVSVFVLAKVLNLLPATGWTDVIARQLRRPTGGAGVFSWFVKKILKSKNEVLEENAVRLCRLENNHKVLEVGFGLGLGLKAACAVIEAGTCKGKVYGIDFSCEMMRTASKLLEGEVTQGKVELVLGDAACIPYRDNTMDRVFHCNCYYFWPDLNKVCDELHRVLKPGGFMITNLNLSSLKASHEKGFLKYGNWDPELYMEALRKTGFIQVEMKDEHCDKRNHTFQSIYAQKS